MFELESQHHLLMSQVSFHQCSEKASGQIKCFMLICVLNVFPEVKCRLFVKLSTSIFSLVKLMDGQICKSLIHYDIIILALWIISDSESFMLAAGVYVCMWWAGSFVAPFDLTL